MAKNKKDLDLADSSNLNQIKKSTNVVFNILFVILALTCIIPVVFIFIISITSEQSIKMNGYQFIPESYSLDAYKFLFREGEMILRALGVSVLVTAVGTTLGVILTMLMGYVLSRSNYKLNGFFTMVVFIPMIFNGGMISSYVVNTQLLNLKNSIWSLILPLCVSSFNVVICKTFFKTNIPESVIESAQIDGATQFQIFGKIALPLSKPLMATLYISNTNLYSLQALLDHVQRNIEVMANNPSLGLSTAQYMNSMPKEGARMAMAIIIIIPIACCYPFFQRYFISGLTVGAVKG